MSSLVADAVQKCASKYSDLCMQDWLVSSYQRMTRFEYLTLWLTFAAIMVR